MDPSGILNLIQDSRLVKTGADIKPLTEPKDVFWLKEGDIIEGRIVRNLPDNRVVLRTNNRELTARTNLSLNAGEQIQVEVQKAKGEILLKVLHRFPLLEGIAKQELRSLLGVLQRPIDKTILNLKAAIQSILSSKTPLEDKELTTLLGKLSNLLDELNITPLLQEEPVSAMTETPSVPGSSAPADVHATEIPVTSSHAQDIPALLKWIRDSGLEWENKLWQLVELPQENVSEVLKTLIQHDLKGLTQKIIELLPSLTDATETAVENIPEPSTPSPTPLLVQKDGSLPDVQQEGSFSPSTSANPASGAALTGLSHHLEQLSQTIQVHQWINAVQHEGNQQFYFQIPLALSDGLKPLDLFIYKKNRKKGKSVPGTEIEVQDYWVIFYLTLSSLGSLRIDLKTRQSTLTLSILTGTETAAHHISPFLPELEKALGAIGYHVVGTKVEKAKNGTVPPPNPMQNLPFASEGMVNIVT